MIEIHNFKEYKKNTLQGFFDVKLTNIGLEIKGLCLHEKNGQSWIQLPAKPYEKEDGSKGWAYILDFYQKDKKDAFQQEVLKGLRRNGITKN